MYHKGQMDLLPTKAHDDLNTPRKLVGYSDADFAADKATYRFFFSGGYIKVADIPVA